MAEMNLDMLAREHAKAEYDDYQFGLVVHCRACGRNSHFPCLPLKLAAELRQSRMAHDSACQALLDLREYVEPEWRTRAKKAEGQRDLERARADREASLKRAAWNLAQQRDRVIAGVEEALVINQNCAGYPDQPETEGCYVADVIGKIRAVLQGAS